MKAEHIVAKSMNWASDILENVSVVKPETKEFFYDPIRKIVSKSLNPETKGMIGCFSSQIINKMTTQISKSLTSYILTQFNTLINMKAKSIKQLFELIKNMKNQVPTYSSKIMNSMFKPSLKSTGIQTQPYIISITPVVSVGIQTIQSRPNSKSVVVSNNFKIKTQPVSEHNFQTDREFEMQSIVNKQSRMFFHTRPHSKKSPHPDIYSKSYQMKKWSMENIRFSNTNQGEKEKKVIAPSYYPSSKNSRAKFYFQKYHQRRSSMREIPTSSQLL